MSSRGGISSSAASAASERHLTPAAIGLCELNDLTIGERAPHVEYAVAPVDVLTLERSHSSGRSPVALASYGSGR